jgi:hypothetical protein
MWKVTGFNTWILHESEAFIGKCSGNSEGRDNMPLYDYHCENCGSVSEMLMNISSDQPQCSFFKPQTEKKHDHQCCQRKRRNRKNDGGYQSGAVNWFKRPVAGL